jgi:hypothetical protein
MSFLAETICECTHKQKFHNEWHQCSKCICGKFHWMDGHRREKIEQEISKLPKSQRKKSQRKKGSKLGTVIIILSYIGIYIGLPVGIALLKNLWD